MTEPVETNQTDSKRAQKAVRRYGDHVKKRELQKAYDQLEARGTLTDDQRTTVSQMASAIVDGVLGPTLETLDETAVCEDTVYTAVEVFVPDESHETL